VCGFIYLFLLCILLVGFFSINSESAVCKSFYDELSF
jgi:hypothetical protein